LESGKDWMVEGNHAIKCERFFQQKDQEVTVSKMDVTAEGKD
jgi:hypothetical protein